MTQEEAMEAAGAGQAPEGGNAGGEISPEELARLYEESFKDVEEGSILRGKIIGIDENNVLVDVGYKSEGIIPLREFPDPSEIKVGQEIDVLLELAEDQDGMVVLSKRKADRIKNWEKIVEAYEKGETVKGRIRGRVKGGFSVDIGMEAFLPASQVTLRPEGNLDQYIGEEFEFKIIKLNRRRKNVVVSRRALLEEERDELRSRTLAELEAGQIRKGKVKNITDFGAFVDIGGIDGLLHITDMAWGRIGHPSEVVKVGSEIEVKVLAFDPETQKISLGLKQLTPNPWDGVEERYPVGSKQTGRVVNITDYGAFVELEQGVEGLIHISEMSWTRRIGHPSEVLSVGDTVEVVVLNIDRVAEKISLGMKQVEPNPWALVQEKYPVGSRVRGIVRNLTDYGAFVEIEEGIDGLVHISDMSWSSKITRPSDVVKKGDEIEAVVLSIDPDNKRISLGLKQLTPDPWTLVPGKYTVGQIVEGTVTKVVSFGAFVEIEEGVEGLVHVSQLSREHVADPSDVIREGQRVTAKIIKLDPEKRKIGLSIREVEEAEGPRERRPERRSERDEVPRRLPDDDGSVSLGDLHRETLANLIGAGGGPGPGAAGEEEAAGEGEDAGEESPDEE